MVVLSVTEAATSLAEVEARFNLQQAEGLGFFPEWREPLPALSDAEQQQLDQVKLGYRFNADEGALTESTVNLLLVSPLLHLAGFCLPPFRLRAEQTIDLLVEEENLTLRGRIDALVLYAHEGRHFWLTLVESKQTRFSFSVALPQALTYMMATPNRQQPTFGMVTNGDGFLFIKLDLQRGCYDFSDDFSLYAKSRNELYEVLRILKRLAAVIEGEGEG